MSSDSATCIGCGVQLAKLFSMSSSLFLMYIISLNICSSTDLLTIFVPLLSQLSKQRLNCQDFF